MVLVQKWPFFHLFVFGNKAQENVSYDILERKNAFQGYKKKKYKKVQQLTFFQSMGVNPWFWSKNHYFSTFSLRQYRPGKCLLGYSTTKKNAFLGQKQEVQRVEKLTFFHGIAPKLAIFHTFFQAIQHRKMSFTIFQNENTPFQAIKAGSSKTRENFIFGAFLTSFFYSLVRCFFLLEYRKRHFPGLY